MAKIKILTDKDKLETISNFYHPPIYLAKEIFTAMP